MAKKCVDLSGKEQNIFPFFLLICKGEYGHKTHWSYSDIKSAKEEALDIKIRLLSPEQHIEIWCQGPETAKFVFSTKD